MAENSPIKPLVMARPGEPITAGRWNEMQCLIRSEHVQHGHTGVWKGDLYDGTPISSAGLANGAVTTPRIADKAVTGDKIDPATTITARDLASTGTLTVNELVLAEKDAVSLPCHDLMFGHSTRRGKAAGRALADLKMDSHDYLGINYASDWKEGVKICSALLVDGATTLTGALTASGVKIANDLVVDGNISGKLKALDVTNSAEATLRCADLKLGGSDTSTRRGTPGRALSDQKTKLVINGAADWPTVEIQSELSVTGAVKASNGLSVSGALLTASNGLTVSGATTVADLSVSGTLKVAAFSEANNFIIPAFDLRFGHKDRRGTPGLALVDFKDGDGRKILVINYDNDWSSGVEVRSALSVKGDVTMKSSLTVAGKATVQGRPVATGDPGIAAPRIIWGYIDDAAKQRTGSGYTCAKVDGPGVKIKFTGFADLPAIIVQQIGGGSTKDNSLVSAANKDECIVYNGKDDGNKEMRPFFFIAIGPAAD